MYILLYQSHYEFIIANWCIIATAQESFLFDNSEIYIHVHGLKLKEKNSSNNVVLHGRKELFLLL